MFHPLRALDARTATEDAAMHATGYEVRRTGRWSRTYHLDPAYVAAKEAAAVRERVAAMGRAAAELHALAFPQQHADLARRTAAVTQTPALQLDQLAAAFAQRMGTPDRLVFERLAVERGAGSERRS